MASAQSELGEAPETFEGGRVPLRGMPLSIELPEGWDALAPPAEGPERLYLLKSESGASSGVATVDVHQLEGGWEEIIKRQTFHLLVVAGADLFHREPLRLHGWRGHKWIYYATDSEGIRRLFYRLYLALPPELGEPRLLVFQGSVAAGEETQASTVAMFNALVRSLKREP